MSQTHGALSGMCVRVRVPCFPMASAEMLTLSTYLASGAHVIRELRKHVAGGTLPSALRDSTAKITLVMGNQAGDADTIVSSIAFGYGLVRASSAAVCHHGAVP